MYQIFTFLFNFCPNSRDFVNQNVEYDEQRMISLSNRVVCGDKCSFVQKKLQQGQRNCQQILLFFNFLYFSTPFFVKISTFSWIKTLKRFNNNWRRSPVGFLMGYVPFSDKKLFFNLTQKMSKSPKNSSFCRFFLLFEFRFWEYWFVSWFKTFRGDRIRYVTSFLMRKLQCFTS